jgi:hypothetical protein
MMPVFGTSTTHFTDGGVNALYAHLHHAAR